MAFEKVTALDDLWSGEMKPFVVKGMKLVLLRRDSTVIAFQDRCAHVGVPLSVGRLDGDVLTCSAHLWQYDVASGKGINPTTARLRRFAVKVDAGQVWVDVERDLP